MLAHLAFRRVDNQARNVFTTFYGNEAVNHPLHFPELSVGITVQDSSVFFVHRGDFYNGLQGRGAKASLIDEYGYDESVIRSRSWTPHSVRRAQAVIWSKKASRDGVWHVLAWIPVSKQVRHTMLDSIEKLIGELYE